MPEITRVYKPETAVTAAIRVKLLGPEDAPAITTTTLPGGTVGTPYSHQLQANGGGFILWELFSGELPDGLTLKMTTGEISGTPTTEETATFTVRAINSVGNDKKELSITIANTPAVEHTVTVSNDGNGTGTATPSTAAAGTTIILTAIRNESANAFRQVRVQQDRFVSLSDLSEEGSEALATYDLYPWEYTSFPVDGDVILIKDDRLADALTVLPQSLRDIFLMYWFLELADREIGEKLSLPRRTVNHRRQRAYELLKELMGGDANE